MKYAKRHTFLLILLSFILCITILPQNLWSQKAEALTLSYNKGIRDKKALTISQKGCDYYKGACSTDNLSRLTGSELKEQLFHLMDNTMKQTITYRSLPEYWAYTDAENGKNGITLFYSDEISSNFNREHVWPKSHGTFNQTNGGSDLHHLRPTNVAVNSTRGNFTMGSLNHTGKQVTYEGKTVGWYDNSKDLFEPLDNVKGDIARIFLYMYVRWNQPNLYKDVPKSELPAFDADDYKDDGKAVIESLDTLLDWNAKDPVDTWEMGRNDIVETIQGNRNVFIDHPEYAWKLFNQPLPSSFTALKSPKQFIYKQVTSLQELKNGGQFVFVGKNGSYTKALSNEVASGRMKGANVKIANKQIINPASSLVWTVKKGKKSGQYFIYNKSAKKYLVISNNKTNGFALKTKPSYYFKVNTAYKKAANSYYITTTAKGTRNISIYHNDFRTYSKSASNILYVYKLVA